MAGPELIMAGALFARKDTAIARELARRFTKPNPEHAIALAMIKKGRRMPVPPEHVFHYIEERGYVGVPRATKREMVWPVPVDRRARPPAAHLRVRDGFSLRPYQTKAVQNWSSAGRQGYCHIVCGGGKCLGPDEPVMLYTGELVRADDVVVGDLLMGPDSRPRRVLGTTRGSDDLFRVVPKKGRPWVCNSVHVLTLVNYRTGDIIDVPLNEWRKWTPSRKSIYKLFTPDEGIDFPEVTSPSIDPYWLGLWFGDGTKSLGSVSITKADPEVRAACEALAKEWRLSVRMNDSGGTRCPTWTIHGPRGGNDRDTNPLLTELRELVGWSEARIPTCVTRGSRETRCSFLAGFIDTDGYVHRTSVEIVQKRRDYIDDLAFIARSLGYRATIKEKVNGQTYWRLLITGDLSSLPMRIPRKRPPRRRINKRATRVGFDVEHIGRSRYSGFQLDGDGRFLLGDFTVTHNTSIGVATCALMDTPALIVIDTLDLAEQWKDRAEQWLEQEDGTDVEVGLVGDGKKEWDARIVVCTLQSFMRLSFDERYELGQRFGLFIFDEVHIVAAATFTEACLSLPAQGRLGLTATPDRNDGLGYLIDEHFGRKVIHVEHRELIDAGYIVPADVFRIETNIAAQGADHIKRSNWLSKHQTRNETILQLVDMKASEGHVVLVLCERKQQCEELAAKVTKYPAMPITGKVTKKRRKELFEQAREGNLKVIFATSLADKGLDIPSISCEVFTELGENDVRNEQRIGRCMRPLDGKLPPEVWVLTDSGSKQEKAWRQFKRLCKRICCPVRSP